MTHIIDRGTLGDGSSDGVADINGKRAVFTPDRDIGVRDASRDDGRLVRLGANVMDDLAIYAY